MAVDKLVDSTQLDSDLTSVANAIRTKGGTSAQLAFPADFVSAIGDIPTGGGIDINECFTREGLTGTIVLSTTTELAISAFYGRSKITSISANEVKTFIGGNTFQSCTSLQLASFGKLSSATGADNFRQCTDLEIIDLGSVATLAMRTFYGCPKLKTVVLRKTSNVVTLPNLNGIGDGTPFASDGTGGTLYVPQDLISSYQSASNWSTILGYANNQIKSIESTHTDPNAPIDLTLYYADGTPISS